MSYAYIYRRTKQYGRLIGRLRKVFRKEMRDIIMQYDLTKDESFDILMDAINNTGIAGGPISIKVDIFDKKMD